jgi:hypothetical protein
MDTSIAHGAEPVSMRGRFAIVTGLGVLFASGCGLRANTIPTENWTCIWDADEARPLADPDSPVDEAGGLPSSECETTCGPPVSSCTRTVLDGGQLGAVCPVCTF